MLAKRIIPCLDCNRGRVVKGTRFVNLRDAGDPVEVAARYNREGADEVVFLDITASWEGRKTMLSLMRRAAEQVFIPLTVGGGISSISDIRALLRAGADKVSLNTAAVKNPLLINQSAGHFGSQCIVVAIDARRKLGKLRRWEVYINGGHTPTDRDVVCWAVEVVKRGAGEILLTSMDRDGTRDGYDVELLRAVTQKVSVPVIASGGAGKLEDFAVAIKKGGASAVLAASLFHYRELRIKQVRDYLRSQGIPVRD